MNGYLISERYRESFNRIMPWWHVTPLPAYDEKGKFIKAQDLEMSLRGSLILIYFKLRHYAIRDKRMTHINTNTFSTMVTQVKVLMHGPGQNPSPYRSLMLKCPRALPQFPSKRKHQINAIRALHPAATAMKSSVESKGQGVPNQLNAEGKKRVREDNKDATTTEGKASLPESLVKRKKKQNK